MFSSDRNTRLWRSCLLLTGVALLLAACGQSSAPQDPDDGQPGPGTSGCRHVIDRHITIPTVLVNGPEECDYLVTDVINVTSHLEIEPGTVIEFEQDTHLIVSDSGSLWAAGTPEERITLRGQVNVIGFWYGICFDTNRQSRLENVNLLNAGKVWTSTSTACRAGLSGMGGDGEPVDVIGTLVAGAQTTGVDATTFTLGEFSGNVFAANQEFGLRVDAAQLSRLDQATDYLGSSVDAPNARPYVWTGGSIEDRAVRHVWPRLHLPFFVGQDTSWYATAISIDEGTTVQVLPGTEFHFDTYGMLMVWDEATLEVAGTAEAPVVFTGTQAVPGAWEGIMVFDGTLLMEHAEVHWAGDGHLRPAAISFGGMDHTESSLLSNVLIQGSASCALRITLSAEPFVTVSEVTFENNADDDICT